MNKDDLARWANRRGGKAPRKEASPPAPPAAPQAPPPPHAPQAYRQPHGVVPYAGQTPPYAGHAPPPPVAQRPVQTTMLVHPGDRDPYAELLAQVPDLAPNAAAHYAGNDAMANNMSQESLAAIRETSDLPLLTGDVDAYPRPVSAAKVPPLK